MNIPNSEQQALIDDFDHNIILYASAGTGKTFSVANKIKKIIENRLAEPSEILCLTFTIKACEEMKQDIFSFNSDVKGIAVKTIHSFCLNLIEKEAALTGEKYIDPTVFDDVDEDELLKSFVPARLTELRLADFLRRHGIAREVSWLYQKDVCYVTGVGLCWKFDYNGQKVLLSSGRKFGLESSVEELVNRLGNQKIVCPECGKELSEVTNLCPCCGFDFRTYIAPDYFKLKDFRKVFSAIKHSRATHRIYSGDDAADYQRAFERLQEQGDRKFLSLFSDHKGVDENFLKKFSPYAGVIVADYDHMLASGNKVDFDDLIVEASRLLHREEVYARWKSAYSFIIVDEMQDTSVLEYAVLKRLFADNRIMMCGDIFQTIYQWRGSQPFEILDDYIDTFHAKVYMFSENYRSTQMLTQATFGYLCNTYPALLGKFCPKEINVRSKELGQKIECHKLYSEWEEAKFIYQYLVDHPEENPADVCIMARSNGYIARLYELLEGVGKAYPEQTRLKFFTVDEDYRFYKKPVVKDFLSLWSVLLNQSDYWSMERLCERYLSGVGEATLSAIRNGNGVGVSISSFLNGETYTSGDCYATLLSALIQGNVVVYDIETTGLDITQDEIIQIAAIRMDINGNILEKFNQMVVPQREISEGALKTHGFDRQYILSHGGIDIKQALSHFAEFVKGKVIVGHNSAKFDRFVVTRQLAENAIVPLDILGEADTLVIAKLVCPESPDYKLETLCRKFGIVNERAHDAFFDVTATAGVLAALCKNYLLPTSEERCRLLGKYRKKFLPFYEHYTAMSVMLAQNDIKTLNEYFVEKFAVRQHYRRIEDNISVDDLMTIVLEESKKYGDARICLSNFLSEAALSGSQMDFLIAKLKKIPIITVHQSKGCEFKTVILAGVDDRHFPSFAAEKSGNEEEEKRVFYVAISRAKQRLIMTYYENARTQGGAIYQKGRSKYLEKIPAQTIEFL